MEKRPKIRYGLDRVDAVLRLDPLHASIFFKTLFFFFFKLLHCVHYLLVSQSHHNFLPRLSTRDSLSPLLDFPILKTNTQVSRLFLCRLRKGDWTSHNWSLRVSYRSFSFRFFSQPSLSPLFPEQSPSGSFGTQKQMKTFQFMSLDNFRVNDEYFTRPELRLSNDFIDREYNKLLGTNPDLLRKVYKEHLFRTFFFCRR